MVIILSLITFGIYGLIWYHMTRNELLANNAAEKIMSPWLILIPLVGPLLFIVFLWQYSAAVEKVTNGKYSQIIAFVMLLLISFIGAGLIQAAYNEVGEGGGNSGDPFGANA
jgi:cytochrome bd-type quinol oxidase subunit 2